MKYVRLEHDVVVAVSDQPATGFVPVEDSTEQIGVRTHTITQSATRGVYVLRRIGRDEAAAKVASRWSDVRADRNARLADCDWTQLADSPLTTEQRAAWATYRQALRDVTEQPDPYALTWPEAP
jgi:hypothetical protein